MKVRWWVCALLFLTWLISYIDRSLMPMAIPFIGKEFQLQPAVMGSVISAFFAGYAFMQIPGGFIADRFGPRKSITFALTAWSAFSMLTGAASSLSSLIWIRVALGIGEGIHAPSAFKALAAWFNTTERARANGVVMCSNTIGPMITPIVFAMVMATFGWRNAFLIISIPGFVIALAVYWYLRDRPAEHPKITAEELAEIGSEGTAGKKISAIDLAKYPALWQLFFIYMTWDVTWWGFQAWLPSYLLSRGFTLLRTGAVAALPFAAGCIGLVVCAYISDRIHSRRAVLVVVLLGIAVSMLLIPTARGTVSVIVFLTAAGLFLPAIHGPFWSMPMDLLPANVMGLASGFINTGGQIAGIVSPIVMGGLIQWTGRYEAGFLFLSASAMVSAILVTTLAGTGMPVMEEAALGAAGDSRGAR